MIEVFDNVCIFIKVRAINFIMNTKKFRSPLSSVKRSGLLPIKTKMAQIEQFLKTSLKSAEVVISFTDPVREPMAIGEMASE